MRQLQLWDSGGAEHSWCVRQSARARRLSVRVFRHGAVEIVVPPRTPPHRVNAFVSEHREWIERQRRRAAPSLDWAMPPAALALTGIGEHWRCSATAAPGRVRLSEGLGQVLELTGALEDRERLRRLLAAWLVQHAQRVRWQRTCRRPGATPICAASARSGGSRQRWA